MKRKVIKTLTNTELECIPEGHKEFDRNAESIYDRPLIFVGRRMTRDEYYEFKDLIKTSYPEGMDPSKMTKEERIKHVTVQGKGKAFKFVWDKCVSKILNVIIKVKGKIQEIDECTDKPLIWNKAEGLDEEIMEALAFFIQESSFSEADSKN